MCPKNMSLYILTINKTISWKKYHFLAACFEIAASNSRQKGLNRYQTTDVIDIEGRRIAIHAIKGKITRTPRVTIILFAPFEKLDPHCVSRVHDPGLGVLHETRAHFSLKD